MIPIPHQKFLISTFIQQFWESRPDSRPDPYAFISKCLHDEFDPTPELKKAGVI